MQKVVKTRSAVPTSNTREYTHIEQYLMVDAMVSIERNSEINHF